jgi:hypothetical protein
LPGNNSKSILRIEPDFLQAAAALPKETKVILLKVLRLLSDDFRHPSLQTKKVQSAKGSVFECRVDQGIRLIYDRFQGSLRCWYVGDHDTAITVANSKVFVENVLTDDITFGLPDSVAGTYPANSRDVEFSMSLQDLEFALGLGADWPGGPNQGS